MWPFGSPNVEKLETRRAVPQLVKALGDRDAHVRRRAAEALGRLRDSRAFDPLVAALQDASADVRKAAAGALGRLPGRRAMQPLIGAVRDEDARVRIAAVDGLGRLAAGLNEATQALVDALSAEDMKVLRAGVDSFLGVVGVLIEALGSDDAEVRRRAVQGLGRMGQLGAYDRVVGALLATLGDTSSAVRAAVAHALGTVFHWRATEQAIELLLDEDEDEEVRAETAKGLGERGNGDVTAWLILALTGKTTERVRAAIADALIRVGKPTIDPLIGAVADGGEELTRTAEFVLDRFGDDAREPLIAALGSESVGIRRFSARILVDRGHAESVIETLSRRSDREVLADALSYPLDDKELSSVVFALAMMGDRRAVDPAIGLLGKEAVHSTAVMALGMIGDPRAVEPLLRVVGLLPYWPILEVEALGRIGDSRAFDVLLSALQDEDAHDEARRGAAEGLGKIGDPRAVEPLIGVLQDPSAALAAAQALGRIGDARAVKPLIDALQMGGPAQEDKRRVIELRRAAAHGLAELADSRALQPLIAALKDQGYFSRGDINWDFTPDVNANYNGTMRSRLATMKALRRIGGPEADQALAEHGWGMQEVKFVLEEVLNLALDPDEAVEYLAAVRSPALVGEISEWLSPHWLSFPFPPDDNRRVLSEVCARALKLIGTPEARRALTEHRAGKQ